MSLADVRIEEERRLYPREALHGLQTALAGFCAAFLGRQDCVWIAEAGLTATCVDIEPARLLEMTGLYPADWTFVCADVFEYAQQRYAEGATYDLVNLDPPSNLFQPVADEADLWCKLADRVVLLATGSRTTVTAPAGWTEIGRLHRSNYLGGVYWTILERD